jgi:hypothetical protein
MPASSQAAPAYPFGRIGRIIGAGLRLGAFAMFVEIAQMFT